MVRVCCKHSSKFQVFSGTWLVFGPLGMKKIGFDASIVGLTKRVLRTRNTCWWSLRGWKRHTHCYWYSPSSDEPYVSDAWHTVSVEIAMVYGTPARLADFLLPRYCWSSLPFTAQLTRGIFFISVVKVGDLLFAMLIRCSKWWVAAQ